MPGLLGLSAGYYQDQSTVAAKIQAALTVLWSRVDPFNIDTSTLALKNQVQALIASGQTSAAQNSLAFLEQVLGIFNVDSEADVAVKPEAFGGISQDGFPVGNVVTLGAVVMKARISQGASPKVAQYSALSRILTFARDEIQDSGRESMSVASTVEPQIVGYQRHVSLPACGRCLILAGKTYRTSKGFDRHPNDDCTMVPVIKGQDKDNYLGENTNPHTLLDRMSDAEKQKALGKNGLKAYGAGADLSSVVNARRGMSKPGDQYTTQGTTAQSLFGHLNNLALDKKPGSRYRVARAQRLSPAGCRIAANGDHEKYVQLLQQNAYIV